MAKGINKAWHLKHPMPEKPTLDQRVEWHIAHYRKCRCLEIPDAIQKVLKKRRIKL